MSAAADQANFPTMIIPRGTEIRVNSSGQLSIKTPGNLVIQNSGVYSELESTSGSIRIEENVNVEAVSVRAAEACFIQGTLTAWRVHAKKIALEDRAKAYIMLQESEQLELSRTSRLVGNFTNEKELFLLIGKFAPQLKELPGAVDMTMATALTSSVTPSTRVPSHTPPAPQPAYTAPSSTTTVRQDESEHLKTAQSLLEREMGRSELDPHEAQALREVLYAVRDRNPQKILAIYREAFKEVMNPSPVLRQAYDHLEQFFASRR